MEEGVKGSKCVLLFLTANSSAQVEAPRGSNATLQQHEVHTSICMQVSSRILPHGCVYQDRLRTQHRVYQG